MKYFYKMWHAKWKKKLVFFIENVTNPKFEEPHLQFNKLY
jgi:hypothetical protein